MNIQNNSKNDKEKKKFKRWFDRYPYAHARTENQEKQIPTNRGDTNK